VTWDWRVLTLEYSLKKTIHVISSEWRHKGAHLVDDAAEGPDIGFQIIGLIFPYLWARVVWCSCLSVKQAFLCDFGNIKITEFGGGVLVQENVGALHVAMQDLELMKRLQALDDLDNNFPDVLLLHELLIVLALANPLEHISIVCIIHHDATQTRGRKQHRNNDNSRLTRVS